MKVFTRFRDAQFHLVAIHGREKSAVFADHQHGSVSADDTGEGLTAFRAALLAMNAVPLLGRYFQNPGYLIG